MTDKIQKLISDLREDAEWAHANEWETPITLGDHLETAANLIESLSDKNKQLEYTLVGVMHFVDKWLDDIEPYCIIDDPSGQIAIDRAAEARRITLEHIEDLTREMYRRGQELLEVQRERNAAIADMCMAAITLCNVCKHYHTDFPCGGGIDCDDVHVTIACSMFEWRGLQEK